MTRKAPWKDLNGNDIFEGDTIQHPDKAIGIVMFFPFERDPEDAWRVLYRDKILSRLCLQIGDKGQAIVID